MVSGRAFVAVGVVVLAMAGLVFAAMVHSLYWLFVSDERMVDYGAYWFRAQLLFQVILLLVLLVPAAFLIQIGRQRIRRAARGQQRA